MTDVASLGITVDSDQASASLKKFAQDAGISAKAAQALSEESKRLGKTMEETARSLGNNKASVILAARAYDIAAAAAAKHESATRLANKEMEKAAAAAARLARESALVGRALGAVAGEAQSLAGALGRVAPFLTSLGPTGLATAAALGAVAIILKKVVDAADHLAEVGGALKDLSDTTGFTVVELQALEQAGARVGINASQMTTAIERLTFSLGDAREGTGQLFDAVRQVDAGLADQLSQTTSAAQAWDVLTLAMSKANQVDAVRIARAAGGRGASGLTRLATETGSEGTAGLVAGLKEIDRITAKQADDWDKLGDAIAENTKKAKNNIAAIFSEDVLAAQLKFTESFLDLSRELRASAPGQGFRDFMDWLIDPRLRQIVDALVKLQFGKAFDIAMGTVNNLPAGDQGGLFGQKPFEPEKVAAVATAAEKLAAEATRAAAASKRMMETLGSTATPAQVLNDKLLQLDATAAKYSDQAGAAATAQGRLRAEFANSQIQATVAALGEAATAEEKYAAKIADVTQKVREQGLSQEVLNRAKAGLQREEELRRLRDNVSALGDAATAAEKYALQVKELQKQLDNKDISQSTFNRALLNLDPNIQAVKTAVTDLGDALAQAFIHGASAAEALDAALKSIIAKNVSTIINELANQAIKFVSGGSGTAGAVSSTAGATSAATILTTAGTTLQASMVAGATQAAAILGQAIPTAAAALPAEAAVAGVEVAAGGEAAGASLIAAGVAAGIAMLGPLAIITVAIAALSVVASSSKKKQEEEKAAAEADAKRIQDQQRDIDVGWQLFMRRVHASIKDTQSLSGQLSLFDLQADAQRRDEQAAGGRKMAELEQTLADERIRIIEDFNAAVLERQQSFQDRVFAAGNDTSTLGGALAAFDRKAEQERAAEVKAGGDALADLEMALSAERLKIQSDFAAKALAEQEQQAADQIKNAEDVTAAQKQLFDEAQKVIDGIVTRAQSLNNRLFTANIGLFGTADTLEGKLAQFDRAAQQQREEEIKAGGENIALLEQTLAAERALVVKDFHDAEIAEQKRLHDAEIAEQKRTFDSIRDYLKSLQFGTLSTLSPAQQFTEAQKQFNQQLSQAQAGDKDALANITKAAQQYLEIARSFLGPSKAFADISNSVQGQLSGLIGGVNGGLIGMASGGIVGGGIWNRDSVIARFAGGGNIALAGGEMITRAPSVNASTLPILNAINRTGRAPANDDTVRELRQLRMEVANLARISSAGVDLHREGNAQTRGLRTDITIKAGEDKLRRKKVAS